MPLERPPSVSGRGWCHRRARQPAWRRCSAGIARADMGEVVGKSGPFMHLPQQIWNLDQRIHFGDFGIQCFGRCGNVAQLRCHDKCSAFHPNTLELSIACAPSQPLQVEVHHLPGFGKPSRAVLWTPSPSLSSSFRATKVEFWHEMFVDRPERSAALDPDIPGRSRSRKMASVAIS